MSGFAIRGTRSFDDGGFTAVLCVFRLFLCVCVCFFYYFVLGSGLFCFVFVCAFFFSRVVVLCCVCVGFCAGFVFFLF